MAPPGKYPDFQCDRTIVLVGMMGAGKTTVGRRLAARLGLPFFDADEEIEKAAGMTVSELFQTHGEESFRKGEAKVIERLLSGPPHVLAAGGGALTDPGTREKIGAKALSIWLKADIDTLARRVARKDTRPLLKDGDAQAILEKLMREREADYASADIHVESQPGEHDLTVDLIVDRLAETLGVAPRGSGPTPS